MPPGRSSPRVLEQIGRLRSAIEELEEHARDRWDFGRGTSGIKECRSIAERIVREAQILKNHVSENIDPDARKLP